MTTANSRSVGGTHYKGARIEHWDYTIHVLGNRYLEGNVTKYVARHRKKHGVQDLLKAKHYLQKLSEAVVLSPEEVPSMPLPQPLRDEFTMHFCDAHKLSPIETGVMILMPKWRTRAELQIIDGMIDDLINLANGSEPGAGYVAQGE